MSAMLFQSQQSLSLTGEEESNTGSTTLTEKSATGNAVSSDKPLTENNPIQNETDSASIDDVESQITVSALKTF
jgi:hypothetical protein